MAVATSTAIALALAAAGAGASYYNTQSTAKKQDREAAAGIRKQSARQREADGAVDKAIDAQAMSSGADEKASVLDQYMQQVNAAKAGSLGGLNQGGNLSDAARTAEQDASLGVGNFGTKIAGLMAAMDAPQLQRQNEALDRANTAVSLDGIGRNSEGDAFLNQLRLQGIRRNPYLDAFSSFAGGASSSVGSGTGGGKYTKGSGGTPKTKTGANRRGGY
ncbi:MAG: hypothetical protein V4636_20080 [Pseudomonadota bacterium]